MTSELLPGGVPLYLRKMTSPEIGAAVKTVRIALMAVGSIEQHGPHLPIDCDLATVEWPIPGIAPLGRVSQEVKVHEMGAAEVLCVPSLEGESFGIVLAEGLAAGLPVIASDLPGYRSVLKNGSLGVLVPPRDSDALERALLELFSDEERRCRLRAVGMASVEELSWSRVAEQVIETYQEAMESPIGRLVWPNAG